MSQRFELFTSVWARLPTAIFLVLSMATGGHPLFVNDHLTLGGIVNPPYLYHCAVYNRTNCPKPGIEFEFIHTLAIMLNFTFDVIETPPPINSTNVTWMEQLLIDVLFAFFQTFSLYVCVAYLYVKRRSFFKTLKQRRSERTVLDLVETQAINMSMSFLTIKNERRGSLDYSQPLMYYRKAFLIRKPSSEKIHFLLTLPFGPNVWICFLVMIPVFFISLTIMAGAIGDTGVYSHFSHNAWTIVGSLIKPVHGHRYEKHASNRCLMLAWQLGKTILLSLYSASLVGFLFVNREPAPPFSDIHQLLDLIESGRFKVVEIKGQNFFSTANVHNSTLSDRINTLLEDNPPIRINSTRQAVQYVAKHDGTVLSGYNTNLQVWSRLYNVCHVSVIEDEEEEVHLMALAFAKDFEYAEYIKRTTAEVANSHYMENLVLQYVSHKHKLSCKKEEDELKREKDTKRLMPLTILQVQGSFWILVAGAIGGMAAITLEFIRAMRRQQHHFSV